MLNTTLFIGGIGPWEIMIILLVALIIFGGRKIPELARDLGSGIREFRRSLSGAANEIGDGLDEEQPSASTASKNKKSSSKKKARS